MRQLTPESYFLAHYNPAVPCDAAWTAVVYEQKDINAVREKMQADGELLLYLQLSNSSFDIWWLAFETRLAEWHDSRRQRQEGVEKERQEKAGELSRVPWLELDWKTLNEILLIVRKALPAVPKVKN